MKTVNITFTKVVPVRLSDDLMHCDFTCKQLDDGESPAVCRLITPGSKEWYQEPVWDEKAKAYRCTKRCRKLNVQHLDLV